ncbi:DUF3883 domain-containing protein [Gordonia amicalis]|uniref:DUF3883 domain-containing protein n=1 Tax=Gordonia amicalis TaxID=89053 RepID=UPI002870A1A1|nr:DUF3883 domain-containing protein [Gordonia amicalis]
MTGTLRNGERFAWWRSFEHFCVPGSSPEAISRDLDRVEGHLRAQTISYRKRPIIGRDDGDGWHIAYIAQKDELEDLRERRPAQADKYDVARAGGTRGNLGPIPPVGETSIVSVDLDEDDGPDADAPPGLWMETRRDTNSEGLGEFLFAAQHKDDDSTRPAFSRVWAVKPGDVVLHYWRQAIRGVSVVANEPEEDAGGVYVELHDRIMFPEPITLDDLRAEIESIVEVYLDSRDDARFGQFPFQINFPGTKQQALHGAAVTYFTAFPPSLVDAVPLLSAQFAMAKLDLRERDREEPDVDTPLGRARRQADPLLRRAVEVHAEDVAIEVLEADGYNDVVRVGKPYDLRAISTDGDELHVEVKGSAERIDSVILTPNEVSHADDHPTTLIVVDEIEVQIGEAGYECAGGRIRRWDSWRPEPDDLTPSQYVYELPVDGGRPL